MSPPRDGDKVAPSPKHPPHSVEAECAVLGAILVRNEAWFELEAMQLAEEDFYTSDHRMIFRAMGELLRNGKPCDFVTLADHMRLRKLCDDGFEMQGYVAMLANEFAGGHRNAAAYAQSVKGHSLARTLIAVGQDIAALGYDAGGKDPDVLTGEAQSLLASVNARGAVKSKKFGEMAREAIDSFTNHRRQREAGIVVGARTGLRKFDEISGGFHGPRLIIIAARPKCGKTALLNTISLETCKAGTPGYVASIEMGQNETAARVLSRAGLINLSMLQQAQSHSVAEAEKKLSDLEDLPLWSDFESHMLETIVSQIVLHRIKHGIGWAAVDHIGLVRTKEQFRNPNDRLGHIGWTLKKLAKRLGIPILALSQLSRSCDTDGRRPRADDLRDSGNLEQDADMVVMCHVPLAERTKFIRRAQLGILANRSGPQCWIPAAYEFDGAFQRFTEIEENASPPMGNAEDYPEF